MGKIYTIRGNKYRIRFVGSKSLGEGHDGECDEPIFDVNEIRVYRGLSGKRLLEVIIHEVTHGSRWYNLSEKFVGEFARDLAEILDHLGYRKVTDAKSKEAGA